VVPSDRLFKTMNALHRVLLRVSPRRFGREALGMPVLQLTTVGRRSGQARSVMLTSPARDGDAIVVVASRGGDDRHPDWFLNLRAEPHVEVALQGAPARPMVAHVATAEERARLWDTITAGNPRYGSYQQRTAREIPVVLLRPRGGLTA
jgi:deazaflavin-dependent oxidoreductase (nitroreductase family)